MTRASKKTASLQQSCQCGKCDSTWFYQGWQCPEDRPLPVVEVPVFRKQRNATCITVPQTVVGSLLGSGGSTLKNLKDVTNCIICLDDRYDAQGTEKASRMLSISARDGSAAARESAVELCARTVHIICEEKVGVDDAMSRAMMELDTKEEQKKQVEADELAAQKKMRDDEVVSVVKASVGDRFDEDAIRQALDKEDWGADQAIDRLYNENVTPEAEPVKPLLNMQQMLAASREANATRKMTEMQFSLKESQEFSSPVSVPHKVKDLSFDAPSSGTKKIQDVFAKMRAKAEAASRR